jgi:hypothetical protein
MEKEVGMTREQAKTFLTTLGIEEPTDEQVTNYLNSVNSETKKEKDRADKLKLDADKAAQLQKQIDEINNQNLSEVEKANKATEDAMAQVAALQKRIDRAEQLKALAEKGIKGEQAEKLISEDGKLDYEVLGQIISDRENAAKVAKEQEIANNQGNPGGGESGAGEKHDEKPDDVKNAELLNFGVAPKDAQDVLSYYK